MCKNLICVCIFGKSLNTFQNFQKSLYEKYKFTTLYFSKTPLKKFFRRPAAGDLDKPGRNNPVGLVAGNHTGLFWLDGGRAAEGRPKKIFGGVSDFSKSILEFWLCIFQKYIVYYNIFILHLFSFKMTFIHKNNILRFYFFIKFWTKFSTFTIV